MMKKKDIVLNGVYTDGKGNVRKVIAIGAEYTLYNGQYENDNLRYLIISKKRGPFMVGGKYNSTKASFASWAKRHGGN